MFKWKQKNIDNFIQKKDFIYYYSRIFNTNPFIIRLLFERKIETEEDISAFFFPSALHFHHPFLLNDMKEAIKRIIFALKQKEKIYIFGDYDVDGMTSSVLLAKALRFFGGDVEVSLPTREEGYGLNKDFIQKVKETHLPSLIITVDNGTSAFEALKEAKKGGIDVIVTDHHEILHGFPPCYAFINPKRKDNEYPFDGLSGVGIAFKMTQALFEACKRPWNLYMWDYIELAAIGTVADMVPLKDENRIFVSLGLQKLNTQPSPFFKALLSMVQITSPTASDIGFRLAPILNSSGRIDDPNRVVNLLLCANPTNDELAYLMEINKKRKQITEWQFKQADTQIKNLFLHHKSIIVVVGSFEDGIIGILASKISSKYAKPCIVISEKGKASCRSGPNPHFSIIRVLENCKDYLLTFGGHKAAAGFSMDINRVLSFKEAAEKEASKQSASELTIYYDTILNMKQFPLHLVDDLQLLEPFGMENPKPIFFSPHTIVDKTHYFGTENQYFKCFIGSSEALSFQKAEHMRMYEEFQFVDFLYTVQSKNQFLIEDVSTNQFFEDTSVII